MNGTGVFCARAAEPASAAPQTPVETAVTGQWLVPERTLWAGELFDLQLRWQLAWPQFNHLGGGVQWSPAASAGMGAADAPL